MHKKLLLGIFILGLLMRTVGLTNHPAGFTPDEASFAYDAYSILNTGRDQWGNLLPLSLKSFGDYKLPLLAYLSIPSVAIFGLGEFSIRFTNALAGSLAILATYFLVLEASKKNKQLALLSAFFLAISPWHIMMSRGAFEANLTTLLLPLTILFLVKGFKNPKYYSLSALFFGLNLFSYHSARYTTPLVIGLLVLTNWKKLKPSLSTLTAGAIAAVFMALVLFSFTGSGTGRLGSSGITSIAGNVFNDRLPAILAGEPEVIAKLFNNKLVFLKERFFDNYLQYFSPRFYFTQGPAEATYGMLPGRGVLYSFEIITLLGFFVGVAKNKIKNTNWLFIWLLLAPVPAALSIGPGFAANRAAIMMPALQIISATGALFIFNQITPFLTNPHRNNLFKLSIVAILLTSFIFFAEDYWYQQPAKGSRAMLYGTREIFNHVKENQDNYDEIIIARRISEPHIFAMFYLKLDPKLVQNTTKNWQFEEQGLTWVDQMPVYHLDKFTFKDFNYDAEIAHSGKLLIGPPEMFPADINKDKIITYPYGSDAYWIVSTTSEAFAAKN